MLAYFKIYNHIKWSNNGKHFCTENVKFPLWYFDNFIPMFMIRCYWLALFHQMRIFCHRALSLYLFQHCFSNCYMVPWDTLVGCVSSSMLPVYPMPVRILRVMNGAIWTWCSYGHLCHTCPMRYVKYNTDIIIYHRYVGFITCYSFVQAVYNPSEFKTLPPAW